jgi:hypothetical protein
LTIGKTDRAIRSLTSVVDLDIFGSYYQVIGGPYQGTSSIRRGRLGSVSGVA